MAEPIPMSEKVEELPASDGVRSRYRCPSCATTSYPCRHWAGPRGFGSPKKPRQHAVPRKNRRVGRGRKSRSDMVVTHG